MANELSLPNPNISPGVVGGSSGFAPNPLDSFIEAYFGAKKQASSESAQAREHEIQLAYLDLAKQKAKNEQAQIDAQAAQHDAQGGAVQAFLKMLQPLGEASAQKAMASGQDPLGSLFGAQQGQGSPIAMGGPQAPAQTPMVPQMGNSPPARAIPQSSANPVPNWAQITAGMSPSATAAFVEQDLPHLLAIQKGLNPQDQGQAVQTGDTVTTFVPGKGFWDAKANSGQGGWVPSLQRGMSADEKTIKMLQIQESRERIATQQAYRTAIQGQSLARSFLNQTKKLQDKGRVLQQAVMNISDALNSPDPAKRRLLASVAILSFQSAAEVVQPQLRYQMVQWFKKNVDQSFTGKIENLGSLAAKGEYPAATYRAMVSHLSDILAQQRSEYEKQRSGEIKRHPDLGNWLPEADEFFTADRTPSQQQSPDLAPPP